MSVVTIAVAVGVAWLPITALASGARQGRVTTSGASSLAGGSPHGSPPGISLAGGAPHSLTLRMPVPTLPGWARGAPASKMSSASIRSPRTAFSVAQLANLGLPAPGEHTSAVTGGRVTAHAASVNVNSVVPPFKFFLNFNVLGPRKLQLLGFLIGPFFRSFEFAPFGGCHVCVGHGQFTSVNVFNRKKCGIVPAPCLKETEKGTRTLTKRSSFIQALTAADKIGRFTVYGIQVNPAKPVIRRRGCLGADVPLTNDDFLAFLDGENTIPRVPCKQAVSTDPLPIVAPDPPFEVSSTAATAFEISGSASGTEWLAVFEGHQPCKLNAQATAQVEPDHDFLQVSGQFAKVIDAAPDTSPGVLCIYLQTGGTYNGIPDGRVTMGDEVPYLAGDTVSITNDGSGSCTPPQGQLWCFTASFAGNASASVEELYVFAPGTPCASTAADEYAEDQNTVEGALGLGQFTRTVNIYGTSSSTYVCAYTNLGAPPANGQPTGPTLAAAGVQVTGL